MMKKQLAAILLAGIAWPGFSQPDQGMNTAAKAPEPWASVIEFGAKGDGLTDDTKAIQMAIDECAAHGKKVIFPEGTFMTGTVHLRNNTTIELTVKAVWKGIGRRDAYPRLSDKRTGSRFALITAENVNNISIFGQGMIDGNGEQPAFREGTNNGPERPYGILLYRGSDIHIEGIQMRNAAFWMQNYVECDHLRITGIRVFNHANLNNDGLDLTDCHDVRISDCEIDSSDDALCPKSISQRGVSDVVIENCILASHASAFKIGTASVGGFRRIVASNLVIRPSEADHIEHPFKVKGGLAGIDIMSTDGGTLEDVSIQNVVIDGVETPIVIKLGNRWEPKMDSAKHASSAAGVVRNITIGNVSVRHAGPIPSLITAYPGYFVENITLRDLTIEVNGGRPEQNVPVPENSGDYPYNRMFGEKLPAYAFFVRHAKNIQFTDVRIHTLKPDERRAFIFDDATAVFDHVEIENTNVNQSEPVLSDEAKAVEFRGINPGCKLKIDSP